MKLLIFMSLIIITSCNTKTDSLEKDVIVYLQTTKKKFHLNDKVTIKFLVKNNTKTNLKFCYWQTPLEKYFTANFFEIEYKGKNLPYKGMMVKRNPPEKDDFFQLKPNEVISQEIKLNSGYDLSKAGKYNIKFLGSMINQLPDSASMSFSITNEYDTFGYKK